MPGATRRPSDATREFRDPPDVPQRATPWLLIRQISKSWATIADGDLLPGELVVNRTDNSLVWRLDDTTIYRFDNNATRSI